MHQKLIFNIMGGSQASFIFQMDNQLSEYHLFKMHTFSLTLSNNHNPYIHGSTSDLSILFKWSLLYPCGNHYLSGRATQKQRVLVHLQEQELD
jgi:hypothetical protein